MTWNINHDVMKHTQCIAKEVMKTPTQKIAIVMEMNKQFLIYYLLNSPINGKAHHMVGLLLEVVIDKFTTLASPNCRDFVYGSNQFMHCGMGTMVRIVALKDHSNFKYIHGNMFPRHSKDKMLKK